jgi:hypothetical protein
VKKWTIIGTRGGVSSGERIRDKIAASKRKGMWMGGVPLRVSADNCRPEWSA